MPLMPGILSSQMMRAIDSSFSSLIASLPSKADKTR